MNKKNTPLIALIVALVGLSFFTGYLWSKVKNMEDGGTAKVADSPSAGNPTAPPAGDPDPVTEDDWIRGSRDAQVILIEYSDLECPYCKQFHETLIGVSGEYDESQFAWVYRQFPLEQLHPKAVTEAVAAECAGKLGGQDAFWAYIDKIFEVTPTNNKLDLELLPGFATEIGLDTTGFQACLDSEDTMPLVEEDLVGGQKAGVRGTPGSFLVNTQTGESQYLPGALPPAQLSQMIDDMLN